MPFLNLVIYLENIELLQYVLNIIAHEKIDITCIADDCLCFSPFEASCLTGKVQIPQVLLRYFTLNPGTN